MCRFTLTALAAAAFLVFLYVVVGSGPKLAETRLAFAVGTGESSAILGPVTLTRPWQFVSIRARAPRLDNSWLDLDYTLVERGTQRSYQAWGVAERYSGSDSDGAWIEGSRIATVKIGAVPRGTYDLVVDYAASRWGSEPTTMTWEGPVAAPEPPQEAELVVQSGAFFGSNLLLALALILLPLLLMALRHFKFEQERQAQSDFGATGVAALLETSDDEDDEDDE